MIAYRIYHKYSRQGTCKFCGVSKFEEYSINKCHEIQKANREDGDFTFSEIKPNEDDKIRWNLN